MALNMDKDVKVERKKSLKEIGVGDIVGVNYEETIETKEGEKPRVIARVVKMIKFIKAAQVIPETSALVSKEAENPKQEGK
jgi:2-iminoacetate synthase ThiH